MATNVGSLAPGLEGYVLELEVRTKKLKKSGGKPSPILLGTLSF
jgi:hypothetical protein